MDRNLALLILFSFCILGPCAVFWGCGKASISALGRNPSSSPRIFTAMIIVLVFAQAAAIIIMLAAFLLFS
ncbi:MAG: hypothetical protein A2Y00_02325 [Omnitrophica WOR_2 bacterium GWF2_43_52]|nr:MAG: hypothetical protein A2062_04745 [Omnitrophica WOR_2 bacterium GWA2_44_7]OGX20277.1 MAG: hypothetical protein A2Y00_02325 [Omnitrophica WOR_2 bacterium GWF2_43_52]HAH21294.1 hypothetical protein [Candidatus Omnitrophota bacterium]HBG63894.1 hypothetical protein [Candidatus Omnitrophota bacterium]HCD39191.1 hypothetical protein [Candidatus Omnitrophota bacterium]